MSEAQDLERFLARAQAAAPNMAPIGKSVLFDLGDPGRIFADARNKPVHIDHAGDGEMADCTVTANIGDLRALVKGELDPMHAMMSGKVKIAGDMGAALALAQALRAANG